MMVFFKYLLSPFVDGAIVRAIGKGKKRLMGNDDKVKMTYVKTAEGGLEIGFFLDNLKDAQDSTSWEEEPPIESGFGHVHCDVCMLPIWADEEHPHGYFRGDVGHDICGYCLEHFIPLDLENLDVNTLPIIDE